MRKLARLPLSWLAWRAVLSPEGERGKGLPRIFPLVPGHHLSAAGEQRLDRRPAGAREAEDGIFLPREGARRDHRSFSVDRPASASTKAMIQKRITTVGSLQPFCSKWWWIGAIRNTRRPVRL